MSSASTVAIMHAKPAQLADIGTTFTLFKTSASSSVPVKLFLPGSGKLTGKGFRVVASGQVTTATSANVTVTLQSGTSATTGSNTTIEASGAVAVNTTSSPFKVWADLIVDDVLKTLRGSGGSQVAGTTASLATLDNSPTSIDPAAAEDGSLAFTVGVTFSSGNASNVADLKDFHLEVI